MNILPAAFYVLTLSQADSLPIIEVDILWCNGTSRQEILRCEYYNQVNGHGFPNQDIFCPTGGGDCTVSKVE